MIAFSFCYVFIVWLIANYFYSKAYKFYDGLQNKKLQGSGLDRMMAESTERKIFPKGLQPFSKTFKNLLLGLFPFWGIGAAIIYFFF